MGHCDFVFQKNLDRAYHDREWGVPVHRDDRQMFEHLSLEVLQCGLSWGLILRRREIFRKCFENFDFNKIANFQEDDIQRIMNTEGMLKCERKVRAIIQNARCYQQIREEFGSFCEYLWGFTNGKTVLYDGHADGKIPVSNGLSEKIAFDLKKRGFSFVGPITIYSHLQACGVINDHARDCPCFEKINASYPTVRMRPDREVGQAF